MTGPHKVRIKIGDAEFEAEGSEESVKQQYADFLSAISSRKPETKKPAKPNEQEPLGNGNGGDLQDIIGRVFKVDGDLISLHFLPKSETAQSDALMMLLYGYAALKNQQMVLGTQLVRAANQSGLGMDRVDRSLARYENENMILKGGVKKGTRYGLNNLGKTKAEELLKAIQL